MGIELVKKPSLAKRTTLGIGSTAEVEAVVRDVKDLDELGEFIQSNSLRPFVLGHGSNLLAPDTHLDMVLIRLKSLEKPLVLEEHSSQVIINCPASQSLPGLLSWARKHGFSGLESLVGIPGSVGGSVAMNAGSYGSQMQDVLTRIHFWTPHEGLRWVHASECTFDYRHFSCPLLPGKNVIWEVQLALKISERDTVAALMKEHFSKKKATQPIDARSAGCIFKNPTGHSAGILLDKAGMKGKRLGNMGFSEIHANFLVNHGGGTAADALELLNRGKQNVMTQFGIALETEVITL